jgi:hypothetical protein
MQGRERDSGKLIAYNLMERTNGDGLLLGALI